MKVVVGLGNPGREYEATRHNVGWWVVDHLADVWRFDDWTKNGEALTVTGLVGTTRVRLVKPLTYMNLSGQVLRPYLRRPFWSAKTDLLVIVDEVALPLGELRLRARGSAGGHNGLKSIEHHLQTQEYPRLRIGIAPSEPRQRGDLADYVLAPFEPEEREVVLSQMVRCVTTVELWLREGVTAAMNLSNRKPEPT